MYLTLLSQKEKEIFMNLAFNLSVADGDFSEAEKSVLEGYCQEMQCSFDKSLMTKTTEELVEEIAQSSEDKIKRIFVFELIGLAVIDGKYDEREQKVVEKMVKMFALDIGYAQNCENLIKEYIDFQTKINQTVL